MQRRLTRLRSVSRSASQPRQPLFAHRPSTPVLRQPPAAVRVYTTAAAKKMAQQQQPAFQASSLTRDLTLSGGSGDGSSPTRMPRLIYGTAWKKEETAELVYQAIKAGFRGIDTAAQPKHYREDLVAAGVRRAVAEGIVARGDLYIQTKFTPVGGQDPSNLPYDPDAPVPEQVHASLASSLANFTLEGEEPYLDCVVLHSPLRTPADTLAAWRALQSYVPQRVRHLGISNSALADVRALCEAADAAEVRVRPAVAQNRIVAQTHFEAPLRTFCRSAGIAFQSFWTLTANRDLLRHAASVGLVAAGAGVGRVTALYALVLGLGGTSVLDGTRSRDHMREDLAGLATVGVWAESTGGDAVWRAALAAFKMKIGEEEGGG